ncbi:DUF1015 domain-containing protein [Treponema sp. OMZ 840]|uniref:DUF1015 domain-containing protein n=1 Tax=Treponema sp. OMZ 840 TaxID=244313 RepID=UPI003D8F78E9
MNTLKKYALAVPDILLPVENIPLSAWAVVACDQYTQDRAYWREVERIAKDKPSAFHIIFPEIYLHDFSDEQKKEYISRIRKTMTDYLKGGVFAPPLRSFVYIERKTAYGRLRKGLVCCIDLEAYDWRPEQKAAIRATEATILDRIPPRVAIRDGAPLETPHIMLLVNDKSCSFIEKTGESVKKNNTPLYDTDLMMEAGRITGWQVSSAAFAHMERALDGVAVQNTDKDGNVFMFAVGDGNHSLATAKTVWEKLKKSCGAAENPSGTLPIPAGLEEHPARYALIEIVNLYDEGLTFEPIHRVLFNTDAEELSGFVRSRLAGELEVCKTAEELKQRVEQFSSFGFVSKKNGFIFLKTKTDALAVSVLQPVLDEFIALKAVCNNDAQKMIDYIHGTDEVFRLAKQDNTVSIMLPPIQKDSFFTTVEKCGALPRKSFSMGEASEKRFYIECRKI